MQILLIRHGQSKTDLLDVHEGKADFPLTQEGREQARFSSTGDSYVSPIALIT